MKAIVLDHFGDVNQLKIKEINQREIANNEVLIKTKAFSVNPVDVKVRANLAPLAELLKDEKPLILGWDISGEIIEIGDGVTDFKIGDDVFGMINFVGHGKTYAEYVAAPANQLALKPKSISHAEAAASTMAALTAWQAFNHYGKLRENDKLLVHAAAGGVGHFAVQIAKYKKAEVFATSSPANKDFVMSLGADHHINYKSVAFENELKDIDFVLETIGSDNFIKSVKVLKPYGTLVALPSGFTKEDEQAVLDKHLHGSNFMSVFSSGYDMKIIAELLEKLIIKPYISKVFAFDEIALAHQQIESGRTTGKIVVEL